MTIQPAIIASSASSPAASPPARPSDAPAVAAARVTPMMEQYLEIKAANPGLLLFYRMGDFYELFFEDAEVASRALGITLTKRGKHQGADIPMCGVPVERADDYLHRLIALGHRVAVCEQTEDPATARKRGNKSVVRRDVVRLVTPGTLTEDNLLDARANNYLLALARARASSAGDDRIGLAWIDISTSEFTVTECSTAELGATLARINPNEMIVTDSVFGDALIGPLLREMPSVTPLTRDVFDASTAGRRLCGYFAVATMDGLAALSRLEATAAAAAVTYVERTQVGKHVPLSPPSREATGATMAIDPATRANLELTRTLSGERRGSLLDAIDLTVTAAGSRLLAQRLPEVLIAASCSKNMGLYRERTGLAIFVCRDAANARILLGHGLVAARRVYSMPPSHGALLAGRVLADDALTALWRSELAAMCERIKGLRSSLREKLEGACGRDFGFIECEKGMFSFLGLTAQQTLRLRREHSVYLLDSSRINVAGVNAGNIDYLADAVAQVL